MRHKQMQGISLLSLACVKLTLSTDASQADERHLRYISLCASCQHVSTCQQHVSTQLSHQETHLSQ